ncbi:hypothetical protein BDD12DRAFT_949352 [Trichophaea hybrida]|nr:hypothetical protein BDD12DRAFT_949352 [Trichophaea hybrida]
MPAALILLASSSTPKKGKERENEKRENEKENERKENERKENERRENEKKENGRTRTRMRGKRLKDGALASAHSTASGSRGPLQARALITAVPPSKVPPSKSTTAPAATTLHALIKPTRGSLTISESRENQSTHRNDRDGYQAPYETPYDMLNAFGKGLQGHP